MFGLRQLVFGFGLLLSLFSVAGITLAETDGQPSAAKILSIDVQGNRYVENEMVLAKMGSKVGEILSRKQLSRDVLAIHKSGFFSDVRFSGTRTEQGIHLVCEVKEYPLIAKVELVGNEKHPTKDLQLQMKVRPGRIFNPFNQRSDLNLIRKGYLKDGYYQVDVKFTATPREDGRVDVLVTVIEGEVTTIRRIGFIGNKVYSDSELRDEIASRESSIISWFTDKDVFDQKRLGADTQLIEQFYLNHGYIDIRVESKQLVMAPDKRSFNLTFSLSEGDQYRVSSVDIQGDIVPDKETLLELVKVEEGRIYELNDLRETIDEITARVGDEGYAFATVTPLLTRNIEEDTVGVVFDIEKGEEVYVERIEITGNEKTDDEVVRRLVAQSPGSRYSGTQVKRSKEEVRRAVYAEDVRVSFPRGSAVDKVNMKIDVTEKKTGSFTAGVGYSQLEKLTLTGSVKEDNAFGKGYQAHIEASLGSLTQNYNVGLTDPYFLGKNMSASVNMFKRQSDQLDMTSYSSSSIGGGIGFGLPVSEHISYNLNYQYERTNLQMANLLNASRLFLSQLGRQTTGEISQTLSWDSRNKLIAASEGHLEQFRVSVAGLGGDNKFYEATFSSKYYYGFGEDKDFVFNPTFLIGGIRAYANKSIPLYRRFSLGGIGSVRGFDSLGISMRDAITNDALGGDKRFFTSMNLFFPIPYMQTAGIRGILFGDAGSVWGYTPGSVEPAKLTLGRIRSSVGVGIEWISPVGPIGLTWALPIHKLPDDRLRSFEFMMGGTF
ncbi:outer membrane protein assembly factor BamA [Mariprofundus sp. KV]|uniref:outer membrane protein assembly factor BamA n=1 Tax=Mariprofundus sp. KV TaxID=2608715 RepID=UPI0015A2823D|nr:outer membrane protein assembly factor BamA [Mariprofundus sp. KV]NWF36442.1 outer membrane protein assembly factor BamA [Mariprofundus sp. KV]